MPLTVKFSAEGSESRAGGASSTAGLRYEWDFDGDRRVDSREASPTHTYRRAGNPTAQLVVTDENGQSAAANVAVSVGNTAPGVEIVWPPDGGVCAFGDAVRFEVRVTDAEDGTVADDRIFVQPHLGHDTHAHPLEVFFGPEGRCRLLPDAGHDLQSDLFTVITARYTDNGARGVQPLTTREQVVLQPRRKQAEHAGVLNGPRVEKTDDPAGGGQAIVFTADGQWASYEPFNFYGVDSVTLRVGAGLDGGTLELRLDEPDGPRLGEVTVESWGGIALRAHEPTPFRVTFFERGGGAGVILRVRGAGLEKQVVPISMLWHRDADTGDPEPGVEAVYYELDDPTSLPDFETLTPSHREIVPRIDFPSTGGEFAGSGRADHLGVVFNGLVTVPRSGDYVFFLESDDGARLYLDDELVIDNDGLHGMVEKSVDLAWDDHVVSVSDPGGTHRLVVVYRAAPGATTTGTTLKLNWIEMNGRGVAVESGGVEEPAHGH